jgi:predicted amidohydrolase
MKYRVLVSIGTALIVLLIYSCSEYDYYAPMECLTGTVHYDTTGANIHLNVASIAMQCDREPDVNLDKICHYVEQICEAHPEVDLIFFGEMILGWYEDPEDQREYQANLAETIPGPATDTLIKLAREYSVYLSFGMARKLDGKLYNAQPLIGPDGNVLAVHHKTYLTPADKEAGFLKGDELTVVDIKGIRTGIVICKDQENSRLTEQVVQNSCDLVLLSFADDIVEDYFGYGSDLSRKYNAWLLTSNRYGQEGPVFYRGEIRVSDPGGNHLIQKKDKEQYLFFSIPVKLKS